MYERQLKDALDVIKIVHPIILNIYQSDFAVEIKEDKSPVTLADQVTDEKIRHYLGQLYPEYAFLTEESEDDANRFNKDYVWIVDPIDGTKDFVGRDGEFTVNIALAYKSEIVVGVIHAPVSNVTYYASKNNGAFKLVNDQVIPIKVNQKIEDLIVVTSRYHLRPKEIETMEKHRDKISKRITVGASLKACLIAEGQAELSYRFSQGTKEWDIAPAQIIVEEAGGLLVKPDGSRYSYNRKDVYNREGYIIANRKENILL